MSSTQISGPPLLLFPAKPNQPLPCCRCVMPKAVRGTMKREKESRFNLNPLIGIAEPRPKSSET
jgi:hypothetical protein